MKADPTSRERIAEAAFELISARGMAGVTMSAIAERAGVARQTLYNHFADVEGIVLWAVDQYEAAGMEQLRQVIAATEGPAAQLEQLVRFSVALAGHGRFAQADGRAASQQVVRSSLQYRRPGTKHNCHS